MRKTNFAILMMVCIAFTVFITPVSAVSYTDVNAGGTVFVGEEGLDITDCMGSYSKIAWKEKSDSVPYIFTIGDINNFYVNPNEFKTRTGNWFQYDDNNVLDTVAFNVKQPSIIIKIVNSDTDIVTGKSVSRNTELDFRIETNLNEIYARANSTGFPFDIHVKSPTGVEYSQLSDKNLSNINVTTNSPFYWSDKSGGKWNISERLGSNYKYPSGKYEVYVECNVNSLKDNNNLGKSDVVDVTIATDSLSMTTNKEDIVRGEQFVVTIVGDPSTSYKLYVKGTSNGQQDCPQIIPSQQGLGVPLSDKVGNKVTTSSSGTRSIGFSTSDTTKSRKWTVVVESLDSINKKTDEVVINVKEGKLSVEIERQSYYMGEDIEITGYNTETDTVYFFLTGPNLNSNGVNIVDASSVVDGDPSTFKSVTVRDDNTFEYTWRTADLGVDSGAYTLYAASKPQGRYALSNVAYDTASVSFRKPFITATVKPSNIAAGDKFHITGDAGVETDSGIAIWIMGKNYFKRVTESVEDDGTFDFEFKETDNMASGQYFVVVQHPMYDGKFNVDWNELTGFITTTYPTDPSNKFKYKGNGALQGSDAANALVESIDNSAIDDTYMRIQFMIVQPSISIEPIGSVKIGDDFVVRGYTNLAVDTKLIIEIVSASFGPTQKTQSGEFSGYTGRATVVSGTSEWNAFELEASSDNFIKDEYIVKVSSETSSVSSSITFNVLDVPPTTIATPIPTTVATPEPTTVPTTEPTTIATPEPTTVPTTAPTTAIPTTVPTPIQPTAQPTTVPTPESPGFGALVALIGLGIVGYLIVRKN